MILVAGATGQLGRLIVTRLLHRDEPVRILVRDGSDSQDLVEAGAVPVLADLRDPVSLRLACAGADAVVTTASASARPEPDTIDLVDLRGNLGLIATAEEAGARRFVFVSALGADPANPMPLLAAKGAVEERLRASTLAWTVLRPDIFMDKIIPLVVGAPVLGGRPVHLIDQNSRRHSFVAAQDVAAFAVAVLDERRAEGQTLAIGGPDPLTWHDVVLAFEVRTGHPIAVVRVPPGESVPHQPDFVGGLLTALDSFDSPLDMAPLHAAYGVRPTHLDEWVEGSLRGAAGLPAG